MGTWLAPRRPWLVRILPLRPSPALAIKAAPAAQQRAGRLSGQGSGGIRAVRQNNDIQAKTPIYHDSPSQPNCGS